MVTLIKRLKVCYTNYYRYESITNYYLRYTGYLKNLVKIKNIYNIKKDSYYYG